MKAFKAKTMYTKNKIAITCLLLLAVIILPSVLHAQPSFTDDVVDAPVDGGLSLLIAGGIGYGIKKAKANSKKNKNEKN